MPLPGRDSQEESNGVSEHLTLAGEALWTVVYAVALWIGWRDRVSAIPVPAILLNVTWELLFTVWRPPASRTNRVLYGSWLLLDLMLLGQVLWWGAEQQAPGVLQEYYAAWIVAAFGFLLAAQWFIHQRLRQPQLQAYVLNLIMSALFVHLVFQRPDGLGLSLWIAWLKLLGTGAISVANIRVWIRFGTVSWLGVTLAAGVAVLDTVYLVLLYG